MLIWLVNSFRSINLKDSLLIMYRIMDVDIDPEIPDKNENPFEPVDTGDDEGESIPMTSTSTHDKTYPFLYKTAEEEETSFINELTPLIDKRLSRIGEAEAIIKEKFPYFNPTNSDFTFDLDKFNKVVVKLTRKGGKIHKLFDKDGKLNGKLPDTIKKCLGPPAEEVIMSNEETNSNQNERLKHLDAKLETAKENHRETINHKIDKIQSEIDQLERENEVIEERMSLRDRVKMIFKKYGFTVFAVVTAVGVVIGVIVSIFLMSDSRFSTNICEISSSTDLAVYCTNFG